MRSKRVPCMLYFRDGGRAEALADVRVDGQPYETIYMTVSLGGQRKKFVRVAKKDGKLSYQEASSRQPTADSKRDQKR